ncbi:MAG TPA: glycine cleavage system protein GcvH [Candidatus Syntrophosphaera sp.]|jgi:glycine cleavage system H protein|nr:glycine cleavage system protein GcvH [Candidatus Cloacimonadota bacterium]OQB90971.1 MAG: Glycine cleavage system H protein [Candidatus Cloacimonetes bacterium ADurb.Bin117]HNU53446.1 glycine cleavage system protein GcvH [Candidatus Syntrophosphaera sp.]HOH48832.1 glycine cleavage system protein GcvH [Candidatus Syntrophosphaera sp.]HOR03843.1 glycine cleavage system protein GcvH [Candidatus Syntrophosphaera sp.]
MLVPDELYYTESHEWVSVKDGIATIGITDFAQHELGDIVFLELPDAGAKVSAGEPCGTIEAVKSAEDLISPVSGVLENKNQEAEDNPEIINQSPYEEGWLYRVRMNNEEELANLLTPIEYKRLIEG